MAVVAVSQSDRSKHSSRVERKETSFVLNEYKVVPAAAVKAWEHTHTPIQPNPVHFSSSCML